LALLAGNGTARLGHHSPFQLNQMESFKVVLKPFTVEETVGNVTVTKSLNQDMVIIVTTQGQQSWGYCPSVPGHGTFIPLSGFPGKKVTLEELNEYVGEVQRQINEIRGENFAPPEMVESGPTAAEEQAESETDEEEFE